MKHGRFRPVLAWMEIILLIDPHFNGVAWAESIYRPEYWSGSSGRRRARGCVDAAAAQQAARTTQKIRTLDGRDNRVTFIEDTEGNFKAARAVQKRYSNPTATVLRVKSP